MNSLKPFRSATGLFFFLFFQATFNRRVRGSLIRHGLAVIGCTGLAFGSYFSARGNEQFYSSFIMPAVQLLDPERAHVLAVWLAAKGLVPRDRDRDPEILVSSNEAVLIVAPKR